MSCDVSVLGRHGNGGGSPGAMCPCVHYCRVPSLPGPAPFMFYFGSIPRSDLSEHPFFTCSTWGFPFLLSDRFVASPPRGPSRPRFRPPCPSFGLPTVLYSSLPGPTSAVNPGLVFLRPFVRYFCLDVYLPSPRELPQSRSLC